MNLQYISDSEGKTTGVFIPISEWNKLKNKYKGIENEEIDVPQWHVDIVRERIEHYKKQSGNSADFDSSMDEIEKEL